MNEQSLKNYEQAMKLRERGRPRTATDTARANNYRNTEGRYELSNGLKFWHMRVVDYFLLHPNAKVKDVAHALGVTPEWLGTLSRTDAFREYYTERMREHQSLVSHEIIGKMQGVAVKALDKMAKKLDEQDLPMGRVKEAAELSLKSLGFGQQRGGVQVNLHNGTTNTVVLNASSEGLARARAMIEAKRQENSAELDKQETADYNYVTSSLQVPTEEIDDAITIGPPDDDGEGS